MTEMDWSELQTSDTQLRHTYAEEDSQKLGCLMMPWYHALIME